MKRCPKCSTMLAASNGLSHCTKCCSAKPVDHFHQRTGHRCRECVKAYERGYRERADSGLTRRDKPRKGQIINCLHCAAAVYRQPASKREFCNNACRGAWRTAQKYSATDNTARCAICKEWLPAANFRFYRGKPNAYCIKCATIKSARPKTSHVYLHRAKQAALEQSGQRLCNYCQAAKPIEDFSTSPGRYGNLRPRPYCRDCSVIIARVRRQSPREKELHAHHSSTLTDRYVKHALLHQFHRSGGLPLPYAQIPAGLIDQKRGQILLMRSLRKVRNVIQAAATEPDPQPDGHDG